MIGPLLVALSVWTGPPKLPPVPGERVVPPPVEPEPEPEPEADPEPAADAPGEASEDPDEAEPELSEGTTAADPVLANGPSAFDEPKLARPKGQGAKARPLAKASADEINQLRSEPAEGTANSDDSAEPVTRSVRPGDQPRESAPMRREAYVDDTARLLADSPRRPPRRTSAFAFGYRIFGIRDAYERPQAWHVVSIEVSPLRRWVRLDFITEVGWEGGPAARDGDRADLLLMEKAGLGVQYPHWVSPFLEFQGGAGMARIELFDRSDIVFVYALGLDAGARWAVTRWMSLGASIGWLRPVIRRPEYTVYHDTFTAKLSIGF